MNTYNNFIENLMNFRIEFWVGLALAKGLSLLTPNWFINIDSYIEYWTQ